LIRAFVADLGDAIELPDPVVEFARIARARIARMR
jgi:hypothetical protein